MGSHDLSSRPEVGCFCPLERRDLLFACSRRIVPLLSNSRSLHYASVRSAKAADRKILAAAPVGMTTTEKVFGE